jgi:hypothetical protein
MGHQLPLVLSHRGDPLSSYEAASRCPSLVVAHQVQILKALAGGDATCRELEELTGLEYHAVARRMSELVRSGAAERLCLVREGEGPRRVSLYRLRRLNS